MSPYKNYSWLIVAFLAFNLSMAAPAQSGSNSLVWGVNVHDGGSDPKLLAETLKARNIKAVRMDLWGNDPRGLAKFRNAATILRANGIDIQANVFTTFSNGQKRNQDVGADLREVVQTAYSQTFAQINATKDLVRDYELQNETPLYPNIRVGDATGQKPQDFDSPEGRLQAASLIGMSRAIDAVRKSSKLPLRIILGTVGRDWGFVTFMQYHGVLFDVLGYHIYPHLKENALDSDPWFGPGGPMVQLASFKKPVTLNEFNAGEIYDGTPRHPGTNYKNQAGDPATENGWKSCDKHLREIVRQKVANIESIFFYEIWDEPKKAPPENRFGLFYDSALQKPKISLLLESSFSGGQLSPAEQTELTQRHIGLSAK